LTEYFAFPQKFLFFDLTRLEGMAAMPPQQDAELLLFLNRAAPQLETRVNADSFRLACVPIVGICLRNWLSRFAFPAPRRSILVVPDVRRPQSMEVYSIDEVESIHPDTKEVIHYHPFYALEDKIRDQQWCFLASPPTAVHLRGRSGHRCFPGDG